MVVNNLESFAREAHQKPDPDIIGGDFFLRCHTSISQKGFVLISGY
jgi:hypothetical protein